MSTVEKLLDLFDTSNYVALEFFGGKGRWQTKLIADKVGVMHVWELFEANEFDLRKNIPKGVIRIGDSFSMMNEPQYHKMFDMINYDNSPRLFGKYCEHFEALEGFNCLLKDEGIIMFNLVLDPICYLLYSPTFPMILENFGYALLKPNKVLEWFRRRANFYGSNRISIETAVKKYTALLHSYNYEPIRSLRAHRNKYLLTMLIQVRRMN